MWKKNSIQWIYILDQILTTIIYVKVVPIRTFNFSPFCTLQSLQENITLATKIMLQSFALVKLYLIGFALTANEVFVADAYFIFIFP